MVKLTGAKKLAFLARLNKGRKKKGLKIIKAKGTKSAPKTILKRIKKNPKRRITLPQVRKARKSNKRPKTRSNVVKKKGGRRRARLGNFLKTGTIGKVAAGIGAATLIGFATDRFAPGISPIAKLGASFIAGGPLGAISQFLLQGGIGGNGGINLSNILGGGGGQQQTEMV